MKNIGGLLVYYCVRIEVGLELEFMRSLWRTGFLRMWYCYSLFFLYSTIFLCRELAFFW